MDAKEVLEYYNCDKEFPDIFKLAHNMNFKVIKSELNNISEFNCARGTLATKKYLNENNCYKYGDDNLITIDKFQSYCYMRYTLAYLLSAYILEEKPEKIFYKLSNFEIEILYNSLYERNRVDQFFVNEKNVLLFTRELLMPSKYFLGSIENNIDDYKKLEKKYLVPDFLMKSKILEYKNSKI